MSQSKVKRAVQNGGLADRARGVVVVAVPAGQRAGAAAADQVQRGVHHARRWSAPRLEGFADMVETSITPRLTSTLRHGAEAVRPEQQSRMRGLMNWRVLVGVVVALGAAGAAAGFVVRKRYSDATAEAEKASTDDQAAVPAQAAGEAQDVNGFRRQGHKAHLA